MQRLFIGEECSLPLYPRGKDESIDFTGFLHASDGQFTWDFGLFSMPYKALQYGYFRRARTFRMTKENAFPIPQSLQTRRSTISCGGRPENSFFRIIIVHISNRRSH